MKRFGRLGVVVFLFLVILVIGVGMAVILRKQSANIAKQELTQSQQVSKDLPSASVIASRPENIYHEVMKSVDVKANITRVQIRGTVKQWQKNILTLVTKNKDVPVSFKDQLQFAKEPMTYDYPGGTMTASKGYINYLYKDNLGTPSAIKKVASEVVAGDEVLILATEDEKNQYNGYVLVKFKDRK